MTSKYGAEKDASFLTRSKQLFPKNLFLSLTVRAKGYTGIDYLVTKNMSFTSLNFASHLILEDI
jgi:hypothetical protein